MNQILVHLIIASTRGLRSFHLATLVHFSGFRMWWSYVRRGRVSFPLAENPIISICSKGFLNSLSSTDRPVKYFPHSHTMDVSDVLWSYLFEIIFSYETLIIYTCLPFDQRCAGHWPCNVRCLNMCNDSDDHRMCHEISWGFTGHFKLLHLVI